MAAGFRPIRLTVLILGSAMELFAQPLIQLQPPLSGATLPVRIQSSVHTDTLLVLESSTDLASWNEVGPRVRSAEDVP
jgi:hypothetical protein